MGDSRIPEEQLWNYYSDHRRRVKGSTHKQALTATFKLAYGLLFQFLGADAPLEVQEHYHRLIDRFKDRPL